MATADVPGVQPVDLEVARRRVLPAEEVGVQHAACVAVRRVPDPCEIMHVRLTRQFTTFASPAASQSIASLVIEDEHLHQFNFVFYQPI